MRHFLHLPFSVGYLARGVLTPPQEGRLVASTGTLQGLSTLDLGTSLLAVDVPVIASGTDLHQPVTPCAVVKPVTMLDHLNPAHRKAGQMGRDRGILRNGSSRTRPPR